MPNQIQPSLPESKTFAIPHKFRMLKYLVDRTQTTTIVIN
jgi:hypothetical protein